MIGGNNFLFPDPDFDYAQSSRWKIIFFKFHKKTKRLTEIQQAFFGFIKK